MCLTYLYLVNSFNLSRKKIGKSYNVLACSHKKIILSDWNMSVEYYTRTYLNLLICRKQASSLYHIKMGGWGRKMLKFDKGRGFPVQVGIILGLGFAVRWLGNMYMMWRLITGYSFVMLVVTALQCNQDCEKISGSQCKTLIKIAVIIVRLQLWFCGFPNICPREEEPRWMKIHTQYRSVSTPAEMLHGCVHVHAPTS